MILGAQLYTVRAYAQNKCDLDETLRRVAAIGYKAVQISAIGPIDPHTVRDLCDQHGLKIALTHIPEARILQDTDNVIKEHDILGCDYIGLGAMSERYRTAEWVDRFAIDFTEPAQKMRDAGKLFMYHNHSFEFARLGDGRKPIDILTEQMPEDLLGFTLDAYWLQFAGCDVCEWFEKLQHRIPCVHLKDMTISGFENRMAAVGQGNMNYPAILALLKRLNKTRYMFVEQDYCYGENPFDCLKQSHDYVTGLGY